VGDTVGDNDSDGVTAPDVAGTAGALRRPHPAAPTSVTTTNTEATHRIPTEYDPTASKKTKHHKHVEK
jgi:hypothetical protein